MLYDKGDKIKLKGEYLSTAKRDIIEDFIASLEWEIIEAKDSGRYRYYKCKTMWDDQEYVMTFREYEIKESDDDERCRQ